MKHQDQGASPPATGLSPSGPSQQAVSSADTVSSADAVSIPSAGFTPQQIERAQELLEDTTDGRREWGQGFIPYSRAIHAIMRAQAGARP